MKNAFCKMCVTICGRFRPDEGAVAGYGNRIRAKYTAKWGVQIAGMIFQTRSSVYNKLFAIPKDILEELPHKNCQRQFQKNNTNIYNVKYKRPGKYPGPNIIQLILVLSQII